MVSLLWLRTSVIMIRTLVTATASAFYFALEFTQSLQRLERVEVSIKAHDAVDAQATHHRNVNRIPCGYRVRSSQNDVLGHLDVLRRYRGDLIDQATQDIKRWLDGFGSPYRNVSVKDLLKDLNVGDQCLPVDDKLFKEPSCDVFVGVGRADKVHRHVGVDENQSGIPVLYPLSISAFISSMSGAG